MTVAYSFPNGSFAMNKVPIAQLLTTYPELLQTKQILNEQALAQVLYFDFEKVLHALLEVQSVDVDQVLAHFFLDCPASLPPVLANINDHKLSHVGFEICEPLDLVAENLPHWLAKLSLILAKPITLKRQLRFSASQAFQQRVNAATEILCLWLEVGEQLFMLELFDIARSIAQVLPSSENALYPINMDTPDLAQHRLAMNYLFQNDSIWHYSVNVENRHNVLHLHGDFKTLTAQHPQYKLAYPAPILNQYDHSFHTKLINLTQHLELEFVTHQSH